jgi:hypothetical protein
VVLAVGVSTAAVRGDAIVSSWSLLSQVYDGSTGTQNFTRFSTVQNPFASSHAAALGKSTVQTAYVFSWSNFGSFLIQATHQNQDTSGEILRVLPDGQIYFTPQEDVSFSVSGTYAYNLPAYGMACDFSLAINDTQSQHFYYADGRSMSTYQPVVKVQKTAFSVSPRQVKSTFATGCYEGAPVSGTLSLQGSGVLPAGGSYRFHSNMLLETTGSSRQFATGSGTVNFSFQPVPEPATVGLLGFAALMLARRRGHERVTKSLQAPRYANRIVSNHRKNGC